MRRAAGGSSPLTDSNENAYVEYTVVVRATDPAEVPGTEATDNSPGASDISHGGHQSH